MRVYSYKKRFLGHGHQKYIMYNMLLIQENCGDAKITSEIDKAVIIRLGVITRSTGIRAAISLRIDTDTESVL